MGFVGSDADGSSSGNQHRDLLALSRRVGFQNIHHFTRLFTAAEACSPAAWRRQYLQGVRKDVNIDPEFSNRIFTVRP